MHVTKLINLVQKYEELYNIKHPDYHNKQRRDDIWREIGKLLRLSGGVCKDLWNKVRYNHRRALNLRKKKNDLETPKMKPFKYDKALRFLLPYLYDDETRSSNISSSSSLANETENERWNAESFGKNSDVPVVSCSQLTPSFDPSSASTCKKASSDKKRKASFPSERSAASVSENSLSKRENAGTPTQQQHIPYEQELLTNFFLNMAQTVRHFPLRDQVKIKAQLFQMINKVEMRIAWESSVLHVHPLGDGIVSGDQPILQR